MREGLLMKEGLQPLQILLAGQEVSSGFGRLRIGPRQDKRVSSVGWIWEENDHAVGGPRARIRRERVLSLFAAGRVVDRDDG